MKFIKILSFSKRLACKKKSILFIFLCFLLYNCTNNKFQIERTKLNIKIDSLNNIICLLTEMNKELKDSVSLLSFPANQRLYEIDNLIKIDSLDLALTRINILQRLFPHSPEASKIPSKIAIIEKRKAALKAEENRIKALGFKVFKDQNKITITEEDGDVLKCSFSGFYFSKIYKFDHVNDIGEYHYRDADKDNTYILADLALSTKAKYAYPPSLYACAVKEGKLERIGYFRHEYASWETYGAFIGNYSESSHDFSKVNTVHYKLGAEISLKDTKSPIIILMFKNDKSNDIDLDGLNIDGVAKYCDVIKILNRNKF